MHIVHHCKIFPITLEFSDEFTRPPQESLEEKVKHLEREKRFWILKEVTTFILIFGVYVGIWFFQHLVSDIV